MLPLYYNMISIAGGRFLLAVLIFFVNKYFELIEFSVGRFFINLLLRSCSNRVSFYYFISWHEIHVKFFNEHLLKIMLIGKSIIILI